MEISSVPADRIRAKQHIDDTHSGSGTTAQRVGDLESLETVARLGLLADNIQDAVDELGTFGVVTLGPVVSGTGLSKDKVVLEGCNS